MLDFINKFKYLVNRNRRINKIKGILKRNPGLCYLGNHFAFGGGFAPADVVLRAHGLLPKLKMTKAEFEERKQRISCLRNLDLYCGGVNVMVNCISSILPAEVTDLGQDNDIFNKPYEINKYWDEALESLVKEYKEG